MIFSTKIEVILSLRKDEDTVIVLDYIEELLLQFKPLILYHKITFFSNLEII